MFKKIVLAILLVGTTTQPAISKPVDDVAIGAAFIEVCVKLAPDDKAIRAGISKDTSWVATTAPADFKLKPLANGAQLSFWKKAIDGHDVLLVLIEDISANGLKRNCGFVIRDERPAMWYFRSVSDQLKQFGMKLKQQDIPHWRFYKGKFANGQSGEVEMRSRSAAITGKDVLHLVVAY